MRTGWIKVELTFLDRYTRLPRTEDVLVEVVSMGGTKEDPEVLFQHMGGTHRILPARDIVSMERRER